VTRRPAPEPVEATLADRVGELEEANALAVDTLQALARLADEREAEARVLRLAVWSLGVALAESSPRARARLGHVYAALVADLDEDTRRLAAPTLDLLAKWALIRD